LLKRMFKIRVFLIKLEMVECLRFVLVCLFCFLYLSACTPDIFTDRNIVIKVEDRVFTTEDLERMVNIVAFENDVTKKTVWSSINSLIDKVVDDSLVLQYGKDKGITLSEIELIHEVEDIAKDYPSDSFKEILIARCIDYDEWVERVKEQKVIKKILDKKTETLSPISHSLIADYYKEHTMKFRQPARAHVIQLVSKTNEDAEALLGRIRSGEELADLAKQESIYSTNLNGHRINWLHKDALPEPLSEVVFSIPIGEVSDIIETAYGYHIIKVLEREPESHKGILDVKMEIEKILLEEKREEFYQKWLEELRENYNIKINYALLEKITLKNENN
jgi:peptidyl-prolyl cis-trans isomerase C